MESINSMLLTRKTTPIELEQLISRLGHLGIVVPFVHHFLSCLQNLYHCSKIGEELLYRTNARRIWN
jgi:hypothetical protein